MSTRNIKDVCPEDGAYRYRPETDVLFKLPDFSHKYSGIVDGAIRHIQSVQLMNPSLWKSFVEQFRTRPDGEKAIWRGEFWGKMMRGATFTYEYTKSEELYEVMCDTVRDLLSTADELGRISTYSIETEFDGWDLWCRKYVLLGLEYFLDICKDEKLRKEVIDAMCAHADYIISKVGREDEGKKEITLCTRHWLGLNSCSILEPIVRLYNLTQNEKYLDYASYIVSTGCISEGNIFDLAYEDKLSPYEYPTTKAYEMMSCFEGLLEYYRVTKIEKYKETVIKFAKRVLKTDITVIGCSGCTHELFDFSAKRQTTTDYFDIMQETCVTVTWMKFCHQLLCVTGDSDFADAIELSAYNAMLGSVNTNNVNMLNGYPFDSYAPLFMNVRSRKSGGYMPLEGEVPSYGCCACIGSAGTALIALSSVMQGADGLYMNLYIPGTVSAKTPNGQNINLKIDTEYPKSEKINIFVQNASGEEEFSIYLRIPKWCESYSVCVCGEKITSCEKGYLKLSRKWRCCDKIELTLNMQMKLVLPPYGGSDENSKYLVALQRGPVTFARDARFGERIDDIVDIDTDENLSVKCEETTSSFDTLCAFRIYNRDGSYFSVCDFQSAGKTWDEKSMMTVWMPTKCFWDVDFSKKAILNSGITFFSVDGDILRPTRGDRKDEVFTFEKLSDGNYKIKSSDGRYVSLKKHDFLDRYYLVLTQEEGENQIWHFERAVTNKYKMTCTSLSGSVVHAYAGDDVFILCDTQKNDFIEGFSYTNNAYVNIKNI